MVVDEPAKDFPRTRAQVVEFSDLAAFLLLGPVDNLARLVAGQGQRVVRRGRQRRPAGRQADRSRLRCGRTCVGQRHSRRCRQHRNGNRAEEGGMRRVKACLRGPADVRRTA